MLPSSSSLLLQFQCCRVDAVTLSGRGRPVRKEMAQVATAVGAKNLRPNHSVADVGLRLDRFVRGRRIKGRPAAAGVVLGVRLEQLGTAAGAPISAGLEREVVLAGERRLVSLLAQDPVLLGRQLGPPFLV